MVGRLSDSLQVQRWAQRTSPPLCRKRFCNANATADKSTASLASVAGFAWPTAAPSPLKRLPPEAPPPSPTAAAWPRLRFSCKNLSIFSLSSSTYLDVDVCEVRSVRCLVAAVDGGGDWRVVGAVCGGGQSCGRGSAGRGGSSEVSEVSEGEMTGAGISETV